MQRPLTQPIRSATVRQHGFYARPRLRRWSIVRLAPFERFGDALWFTTLRTPPLWQRGFFLVNCLGVATFVCFGEKWCRKNVPLCDLMAQDNNPYQSPESETRTASVPSGFLSHRRCPKCCGDVHWTRFWLRGWIWAKWPCSDCGVILTFDRRRRLIAACCAGLVTAMCFAASFYFGFRPSSAIQAGVLGGACAAFSFPMLLIDGLAVAEP